MSASLFRNIARSCSLPPGCFSSSRSLSNACPRRTRSPSHTRSSTPNMACHLTAGRDHFMEQVLQSSGEVTCHQALHNYHHLN